MVFEWWNPCIHHRQDLHDHRSLHQFAGITRQYLPICSMAELHSAHLTEFCPWDVPLFGAEPGQSAGSGWRRNYNYAILGEDMIRMTIKPGVYHSERSNEREMCNFY